jgi:hypothetical protein
MSGAASTIFPSITGALINGIGTNILAGGDTIKGLLTNASFLAGSQGLNASPSALSSAGASNATNTMFANPAGVNPVTLIEPSQGASYTSAAVPDTIFSTVPSTQAASLQAAQPLSSRAGQAAALERPLSLTMPGVEPGQGYEYTMGDRLAQVGQFAQDNQYLTQMAMQTGQGLLKQPDRPQVQSPGLLRGNPTQVQAPQYQVGIPQVTLI